MYIHVQVYRCLWFHIDLYSHASMCIELVFIYLLPMPTVIWSFLLSDSYLMILLLYIHLICISSYTISLNLLSICISFMLSYMSTVGGCLCSPWVHNMLRITSKVVSIWLLLRFLHLCPTNCFVLIAFTLSSKDWHAFQYSSKEKVQVRPFILILSASPFVLNPRRL